MKTAKLKRKYRIFILFVTIISIIKRSFF